MSPSLTLSPSLPLSSSSKISSPPKSEQIPFPASSITPAKLATLIENASRSQLNACAGSRRSQPLILDLRPQTDFSPLSIQYSINISMPTLLMRRYRRGVAVSSCSIESFITMPSDKDLFHSIQESWSSTSPVDIIVLDQEMSAGPEEYGRSTTAAWTLVNVLEQGAGIQQQQQQQFQVWYLEGGFEAFQTWDAGEKFMVREGLTSSLSPVRRESLFSLNTKVVQRPAGLARSQTNKGEQEISCILPGFLYLGPEVVTEAQAQELQSLGVQRVLNMAQECEDKVIAHKDQFEYHKIGVQDHVEADVSAGLLKAVEIIASSTKSPIYVHCKAGKSRSVTATIAYLIMHLHWPLNKAYQHVLTQRPCMCPNIGFVTELMKVEKQTFGAEATGLHMRV
ncbi:MAG: protein-tyrosine phosphatase-like protein [Podila humilis]|nr:MAG: protein-tyrosine phosphatase-like protein [Podila humilis]